MPKAAKRQPNPKKQPTKDQPSTTLAVGQPQQAKRKPNGQWAKGYSGWSGTADAARARRDLNLATIGALRAAFDRGGAQAIDKVMRQQPAIFLKMLVLLVPRELEVTHSGGVKAMSDEAIEGAIEQIKSMLAKRAGDDAKVVEGTTAEDVSAIKP